MTNVLRFHRGNYHRCFQSRSHRMKGFGCRQLTLLSAAWASSCLLHSWCDHLLSFDFASATCLQSFWWSLTTPLQTQGFHFLSLSPLPPRSSSPQNSLPPLQPQLAIAATSFCPPAPWSVSPWPWKDRTQARSSEFKSLACSLRGNY